MVQLVGMLSPILGFGGRSQGLAFYSMCVHHMGYGPRSLIHCAWEISSVDDRLTDLQADSFLFGSRVAVHR